MSSSVVLVVYALTGCYILAIFAVTDWCGCGSFCCD